ncbi:MAG: hypothetical protein JZU62_05580 [Sulfuricurvum sp.]|uniref:hypothetical protein n=1 Tax=Sulfuricurvum sp. TaxID=2025608 RepID=UPI0026012E7C|nr:hypothetical protein [Sulfuricurvum sp.]MBV5321135.1 hypothetical protein [Sulfuricurvum sp.]
MTDKEELLTTIIDHAISKGAPIIGWQYSENGKVIILRHNAIPLYRINLFQAMDLLIHQYNLSKQYSFIYTQTAKKIEPPLSTEHQASKTADETFEGKTIELCNAIILNSSQPFNVDAQNKIYNAIHKANHGKHVSQNDFLMLRTRLTEHYNNIHLSSNDTKEKENLRKVIRFFDKMRYKDFTELF